MVLNVLINVLLLNRLTSIDFGRFSLAKTIFQSFEFSHLGSRNAFDRIFPVEKDRVRVSFLFSTGFLINLVTGILLMLMWIFQRDGDYLFYLLFIIGGQLSSSITLFRVFYRSFEDKKRFVELSSMTILLPTIFQILGFLVYNLLGLALSYLLSYIILVFIIYYRYKVIIKVGGLLKKEYFLELLDKGFLLYLSSFLAFISLAVDRFVIESYWSIEAVGRFSAILFFFSIFTIFSVNYTEMYMNKLVSERSLRYVARHCMVLLGLSILLIIIASIILPYILQWFMPKYIIDLDNIRLVMIGVIPFSIRSILYYYLHGMDKRKQLLIADIISTILYFCGLVYLLLNYRTMENIIIAKVLYYFLNLVLILFFIGVIYLERKNTNLRTN